MNCIYTCTLGDYDQVLPPVSTTGWDYILFSDHPAEGWEFQKIDKMQAFSNSRTAREYKINIPESIFEGYDLSIWMDANFEITGNLDEFVSDQHQRGLSIMEHPLRNCAYDEANMCKEFGKDSPEIINEQIEYYESEGLPRGFGLPASGILVRDHTEEVKQFCSSWWGEVRQWSKRDQISFPFVCWREDFQPHYYQVDYMNNIYFKYHSHKQLNRGIHVWN